jgi:hypothetical protein
VRHNDSIVIIEPCGDRLTYSIKSKGLRPTKPAPPIAVIVWFTGRIDTRADQMLDRLKRMQIRNSFSRPAKV